jgi:hypothetical protein
VREKSHPLALTFEILSPLKLFEYKSFLSQFVVLILVSGSPALVAEDLIHSVPSLCTISLHISSLFCSKCKNIPLSSYSSIEKAFQLFWSAVQKPYPSAKAF